jgi:hypothetical protein
MPKVKLDKIRRIAFNPELKGDLISRRQFASLRFASIACRFYWEQGLKLPP